MWLVVKPATRETLPQTGLAQVELPLSWHFLCSQCTWSYGHHHALLLCLWSVREYLEAVYHSKLTKFSPKAIFLVVGLITNTDVFRCHGIAYSNFQDNFARQLIIFEEKFPRDIENWSEISLNLFSRNRKWPTRPELERKKENVYEKEKRESLRESLPLCNPTHKMWNHFLKFL